MKLIKNVYEGDLTKEAKKKISDEVKKHDEIIIICDELLTKHENNDDVAIMVVSIIISFNSINKQVENSKVKSWIMKFSLRLIHTPDSKDIEEKFKIWYMEKYVFILELLITKNLDVIDDNLVKRVAKILSLDIKLFNKTMLFKLLKIIAHL